MYWHIRESELCLGQLGCIPRTSWNWQVGIMLVKNTQGSNRTLAPAFYKTRIYFPGILSPSAEKCTWVWLKWVEFSLPHAALCANASQGESSSSRKTLSERLALAVLGSDCWGQVGCSQRRGNLSWAPLLPIIIIPVRSSRRTPSCQALPDHHKVNYFLLMMFWGNGKLPAITFLEHITYWMHMSGSKKPFLSFRGSFSWVVLSAWRDSSFLGDKSCLENLILMISWELALVSWEHLRNEHCNRNTGLCEGQVDLTAQVNLNNKW